MQKSIPNNKERLLSLQEKVDIGADLLKMLESERQEKLNASNQLIEALQTLIHVANKRFEYVTKNVIDFKKDVIIGKIPLEKWFESKNKQRLSLINRMDQKCIILRKSKTKLQILLNESEESRKKLQYIDFHQLQIESEMDSLELEKVDQDVLRLKEETTNVERSLNKTLASLNNITYEHNNLQKQKASRETTIKKLLAESDKVRSEIMNETQILKKKAKQNSKELDAACPEIDDYIGSKAKFYQLKSLMKNWERKVEIAEN